MTPLRILLVDDEPSLLLTLAANLELEGLEIDTAENGLAALAVLKQKTLDLVLSDVRMPGMNGVELFREIRKLHPDLPVILMTAFAVESLVDQAIREGAFTVLPKPFDIQQALQTLILAARHPATLIIDGTPKDATSAAGALQAMGLRAYAEVDAEGALRTIRDQPVDVCVIELAMATSGSPTLLSRLKELEPSLSFIALTGQGSSEPMRQIAAITTLTWIRKPVDPKVLAQSIAQTRSHQVVRK